MPSFFIGGIMPIFKLSSGKIVYVDAKTGDIQEVALIGKLQLTETELKELNVKMLETSTLKDKN
jgi:hypothetical protein